MKNTEAHPLELAAVAALLVLESIALLLRLALVPVVALLLTVARWRPQPQTIARPAPVPQQEASAVPVASWCPPPWLVQLEALSVAELRRLARELGLPRCLSSKGRRADLLLALAVEPLMA